MTLTPGERRWLDEEAQETLGLTRVRTKILAAVLDRDEPFSMRGIGRQTGQSAENVRLALELMVARELIELQAIGDTHRPKASYTASPGRRLRILLGAALPPPPASDALPRVAQNS